MTVYFCNLKKLQKIQIFQIGYSQTISNEELNTGQYFEKRRFSQEDMLNLHKMFTDKDSIQDFHDGNDYFKVGFQIVSAPDLPPPTPTRPRSPPPSARAP